ncbi:MAG TPA: double zinc ribbon domain-containing protein, partial [Pyrinomonadaceae bacterium]
MKPAKTLGALYDAWLALVYPRACAACGAESVEARADAPACAACWDATRQFGEADTLCWKCGAPTRGDVAEGKRGEVRCRRCEAEAFTA